MHCVQTRTVGGRALELATNRVQNKASSTAPTTVTSLAVFVEERRKTASDLSACSHAASEAIGAAYKEDVQRLIEVLQEQSAVQAGVRDTFLGESERLGKMREVISKLVKKEGDVGQS
jgi:predicted component of type VI protein secretion system